MAFFYVGLRQPMRLVHVSELQQAATSQQDPYKTDDFKK